MAEPVLVRFSDPVPPARSASLGSRREFLQRVAVAALATTVGTTQPAYAVLLPKRRRHRHRHDHIPKWFLTRANDRDAPRVFGGDVLEVTRDRVTLLADGTVRHVPVSSRSTLWRGGYTTPDRLIAGDRLLVRTNGGGELERGWSNLVRLRGRAVGITGSPATYAIQPYPAIGQSSRLAARSGCTPPQGDPCDIIPGGPANPAPVIVETDPATEYINGVDSDIVTTAPSYLRDRPVIADIVGFDNGNTIRAFSFTYVLPGTEGEFAPSSDDLNEEIGDYNGLVKELEASNYHCMYGYMGYATWFQCNGARCGNCSSGNSRQLAWPTLDSSSCGCGSNSCCRFSCRNQVRLACGSKVTVIDKCHARAKNFHVVDCGPNQHDCSGDQLCNRTCRLCGHRGRTPLVDLTQASFARFFDPARRGCFPCAARVYLHGPGCG